jgi:hypothetical protein
MQEFWDKRYLLSGIAKRRHAQERHLELPSALDANPRKMLQTLLRQAPQHPTEGLARLLRHIGNAAARGKSGQVALVPRIDYPWGFSSGPKQFLADLKALHEDGLIKLAEGRGDRVQVRLTLEGWKEARKSSLDDGNGVVFVAMPFGPDFDQVFHAGIAEAVRRNHMTPRRMDQVPHTERIDERILGEIRRATALVIDTTYANPNVMFEAGFAMGLSKPIVWTCRLDYLPKLKDTFDIRQYRHIPWAEGQEAQLAIEVSRSLAFARSELAT